MKKQKIKRLKLTEISLHGHMDFAKGGSWSTKSTWKGGKIIKIETDSFIERKS